MSRKNKKRKLKTKMQKDHILIINPEIETTINMVSSALKKVKEKIMKFI